MTVTDLWKHLPKTEIAARRKNNRPRWQRRWRDGVGRDAVQRKQSYQEHQKAQAFLDDASQMGQPKARAIRAGSTTVNTLLDRELATKRDLEQTTIEIDQYHANVVREAFGGRVVSTLEHTEIDAWAHRTGVADSSRKKQLEMLRAAIKRGMRDKIVAEDPTDGIVVPLKKREPAHWSYAELIDVIDAARDDFDRTLLSVLGLMGLRRDEARLLRVGYLRGTVLDVRGTKTDASVRSLPVPPSVLVVLERHVARRTKDEWMFPSPRKPGAPIADTYPGQALTRAVARANAIREVPIRRIHVHGLRHTFAAVALSELRADTVLVSRALGHSRPSTTLNHYGHLAPRGLEALMREMDGLKSVGAP